MRDAISIECPHCGETFSIPFDLSEGDADFVTDCEVCCRPIELSVRVRDGDIAGLEVGPG